jgi:DNA modification methylase
MTPRWRSDLTGSEVYEGDARIVAQTLPARSVTCSILDGPYNLRKAEWDRVPRGGTLGDLYTGHLDDVGRLSAPSASLYLWNTSAGWAELHPLVLARGWTFRSLIVWHKPDGAAIKSAHEEGARTWPEVMEVCGFYQREPDWSGLIRRAIERCGKTRAQISREIGCDSRLLQFWEEGERFPSLDLWRSAWRCMAGPHDIMKGVSTYLMQGQQNIHPYTDTEIEAEWRLMRPPFTCPLGVGNVWTQGAIHGSERLRSPDGGYLHPCQKPLIFAERMIRASTRPGDTVWVPFGGTLREMVAAERMARGKPSEARRVISCELNADGKDYIGPAVAQAQGLPTQATGQADLFGGGQ